MTSNIEQIDVSSLKEEIFKATPQHLIADIIAENYPDARITDTLIESYINLALTREFTLDKTIHEIRKLNSFDSNIDGKISFVLSDKTEVMVSEDTFVKICESINSNDIIQFMRMNKDNFLNAVDLIKE